MQALAEAADLFGVEQTFWDIFGTKHEATEDVQKAIFRSLGVDTSSDAAFRAAIEQRRKQEWTSSVSPTLVVSQSQVEFPLHVPASRANDPLSAVVLLEDGSRCEYEVHRTNRSQEEQRAIGGQSYARITVALGNDLPLGYHKVELAMGGQPLGKARLIVCPDRAYEPEWLVEGKAAGIAVSLYGLRSERNWGCGDTSDLRTLIDWAAEDVRAAFVALNPLHAISNRQPYNTSPYLPNSSFYRNPIYLDLERIEDFECASGKVSAEAAELRASEYVEYERVSRLKMRCLKSLFRRFLAREYRHDTDRAKSFREYAQREGKLLDLFAVHSALDEAIHKENPKAWNWHDWPKAYQDPESAETREFANKHWRPVLFHKYVQWQLDVQFAQAQAYAQQRGLKIGLYHDLALATDRFGSDLWAHGPFYAAGCRVGSPPDAFSPKGQDWAFPPPNSERHLEDGYQLFAESIRKASAHGGALRIDHVMRFFRLYWIPDGKDASEGTYVRDRYEELVRILALESVRGKFIVVGEDLGTVPDIARETLDRFGVMSYRLFYFEQDKDKRFKLPEVYPRQALVSPSTHDLPTLAGFWQNADIKARKAAGVIGDAESYRRALEERAVEKQKMLDLLHQVRLLPEWFPRDAKQTPELTGELHNAVIGFLAITPSKLLVVSQEDLFKDPDQQNLPGTTAEHPNWRHKMKVRLEDLRTGAPHGYSLMLRNWLERTGRAV